MRIQLLAFAGLAAASSELVERSLASAGGWSLSTGTGSCPSGTSTCFSNQTGLIETSNRLNNCCPSGTTPRLDCGTYVNTGQPYACCPLDNPDCRGDVEKTVSSDVCANSGWALWYIPSGGYNSFCCLPGQYGYWYPALGQDAVGQCYDSNTLPSGSSPATQVNNGDGTVNSAGVQVVALVAANETCDGYGICKSTTAAAPTCDVIHYGWSLQASNSSSCTTGSNMCSYNGVSACCPTGLTCGTVIGDGEVPVCCPPGNPDCRGDVEGLWPQVCADSSWALWHVNANGNHFCCKPGQIGYNRVGDVYATGVCGNAVPTNTNTTTWMRSILDYVGDGSTAGSHLSFPCDTSPAPNASYASMCNAILNPPATLNPFSVTPVTALYPNVTTVYLPTSTAVATGNSPYAPGAAGNNVAAVAASSVVSVAATASAGSGSGAAGSQSYATTVYETVCTSGGITSTIAVTSVVSKAAATTTSTKASASGPSSTSTAVFTGAAAVHKIGGAAIAAGVVAALF